MDAGWDKHRRHHHTQQFMRQSSFLNVKGVQVNLCKQRKQSFHISVAESSRVLSYGDGAEPISTLQWCQTAGLHSLPFTLCLHLALSQITNHCFEKETFRGEASKSLKMHWARFSHPREGRNCVASAFPICSHSGLLINNTLFFKEFCFEVHKSPHGLHNSGWWPGVKCWTEATFWNDALVRKLLPHGLVKWLVRTFVIPRL